MSKYQMPRLIALAQPLCESPKCPHPQAYKVMNIYGGSDERLCVKHAVDMFSWWLEQKARYEAKERTNTLQIKEY